MNAHSYTLDELTTLALNRSATLSAQELETRALQSEVNQKGKWQNPQLMSQLGTLKSGNILGPTVEVSFTQAVPLSDKFSLRKEIALLALNNQKSQSDFFKQWISHQTILAAWKVHVTSELLKHNAERAERLSLIKKYHETRPKVTIRQRVELSIISTTLVQLERMQDEKKQEYALAQNDLEFWVGAKLTQAEIPLKLPDQYNFHDQFNVETSKDFELFQAQNSVKLSTLDSELAAKEKRPDLFLGGGYRIEKVTPENHFQYAIIGLNIPIWDTGSSRVEATKARESKERKLLEETEKKLVLKQKKQIAMVEFSISQLKRFPKSFIRINEKAIKEAEVGFKQGILDVNTFILAETQSHEVIDQVYMSWMNYLENLSSLQLMRGENLKWEGGN